MIFTSLDTEADWLPNLAFTGQGMSPHHDGISQSFIGIPIRPDPQTTSEAIYNASTYQGPASAFPDQTSDLASGPTLPIGTDITSSVAEDGSQCWNQEDIDRILSSLQESLPDVGRLFDGSIGMF